MTSFPQNRGDQSGALALVGDFKNFDTASVLKADLSRLKLPPETGGRCARMQAAFNLQVA